MDIIEKLSQHLQETMGYDNKEALEIATQAIEFLQPYLAVDPNSQDEMQIPVVIRRDFPPIMDDLDRIMVEEGYKDLDLYVQQLAAIKRQAQSTLNSKDLITLKFQFDHLLIEFRNALLVIDQVFLAY